MTDTHEAYMARQGRIKEIAQAYDAGWDACHRSTGGAYWAHMATYLIAGFLLGVAIGASI